MWWLLKRDSGCHHRSLTRPCFQTHLFMVLWAVLCRAVEILRVDLKQIKGLDCSQTPYPHAAYTPIPHVLLRPHPEEQVQKWPQEKWCSAHFQCHFIEHSYYPTSCFSVTVFERAFSRAFCHILLNSNLRIGSQPLNLIMAHNGLSL